MATACRTRVLGRAPGGHLPACKIGCVTFTVGAPGFNQQPPTNNQQPTTTTSARAPRVDVLIGAVLLLAWIPLLRRVAPHWGAASPYAYGVLVPILAWVLFARSWEERPAGIGGAAADMARRARRAQAWLALLLAGYVPWIIVLEANIDFALFAWVTALFPFGICVVLLWWVGGVDWVRRFWFPAAFVATALPWPGIVELYTVHRLKFLNTDATVHALGLLGIDAAQRGNVVELAGGISVGVVDACSGIRSLPPSLMAALFLGDFLRLGAWRRVLLLAAGALAALTTNLARTIALALVANLEGDVSTGIWHEALGLGAVLGALALLFAVALLLRPRRPPVSGAPPTGAPGARTGAGPQAAMGPFVPALRRALWIALVACVAIELGVEGWYRAHESRFTQRYRCRLEWPRSNPTFRTLDVPEAVYDILKPTRVDAGQWIGPGHERWLLHLIWWGPGSLGARVAATRHNPGICLTSQGMKLLESYDAQELTLSGLTMPCRAFLFEDRGRRLHAFYALWRDYAFRAGHDVLDPEGRGLRARFRAAGRGERVGSQYVIEAVVDGFDNVGAACSAFEQVLRDQLRIEPRR